VLAHGCDEGKNSAATDNRTAIVKSVGVNFAVRNKRKRKERRNYEGKFIIYGLCKSTYGPKSICNFNLAVKTANVTLIFAIFLCSISIELRFTAIDLY
jgi:hypothetical protein